jgi:hypothetical protein
MNIITQFILKSRYFVLNVQTVIYQINIAAKANYQQENISTFARQIDYLAYHLYNLTWEEIKVIEPKFPLGKAEYEGIGGEGL